MKPEDAAPAQVVVPEADTLRVGESALVCVQGRVRPARACPRLAAGEYRRRRAQSSAAASSSGNASVDQRLQHRACGLWLEGLSEDRCL